MFACVGTKRLKITLVQRERGGERGSLRARLYSAKCYCPWQYVQQSTPQPTFYSLVASSSLSLSLSLSLLCLPHLYISSCSVAFTVRRFILPSHSLLAQLHYNYDNAIFNSNLGGISSRECTRNPQCFAASHGLGSSRKLNEHSTLKRSVTRILCNVEKDNTKFRMTFCKLNKNTQFSNNVQPEKNLKYRRIDPSLILLSKKMIFRSKFCQVKNFIQQL